MSDNAPAATQSSTLIPGGASDFTVQPGVKYTLDNPTPAPAASSNKALLVTSNAARSATAANTTKLQAATSSLYTPASTANGGGTAQQTTPNGNTTTPATTINIGSTGNPVVQQPATGQDPAATATNPDGTPKTSNADAVSSIKDPAIASQYKASLDALDQQKTQAQANIDAAQATVANDPAANAAIQSIKDKYAVLEQALSAKNGQVIGQANTSVAAFGGLGVMSQNFLNDQSAKAEQRMSSLVAQEQDLILKAQIAYQTKDQKALNDAMTQYDKVNADKLKAINDLLSQVNKQVTQAQAQQRLDATAQKQTLTTDVTTSTNIATSIAKNIADSGITDQAQIDSYIQDAATQYGISNPEILSSAIQKAQAAADKAALSAKNTNSIITKRNQPKAAGAAKKVAGSGTDGSYSYTADDISAYKGLINSGGVGPDGTKYNARGGDTYVDPGAYTAAYTDWKAHGGTPAGFLKKFPISDVNPASVSKLPSELQPKTKTASTTQQPPP